jgi:hypothetical protein
MRRLVLILVAIVSFAAVGATGVNNALALTTTMDVSSSTTLCAEPDQATAVKFRPCGKMRNGVALPCHADALPPSSQGACLAAARPVQEPALPVLSHTAAPADRLFRPPRLFA